MNTTTSDDGATAQPSTEPEAVQEGHNADQVITNDDNGTPTLEPLQAPESADEAVSEDESKEESETQADESDITEWAKKKGLPLDDPVKLATMYRDAEKKMHEATAQVQKSPVQPPEPLEPGDDTTSQIVERQNQLELKTYVRDWFDSNPEMKTYRGELTKIAEERPWLQNMDDVRAHFLADPTRLESLRKEGGREALQNIAQKQQQVPPSSGATNSNSYQSATITPSNVYDLVERNDQEWFEKNHKTISRAMEGKPN